MYSDTRCNFINRVEELKLEYADTVVAKTEEQEERIGTRLAFDYRDDTNVQSYDRKRRTLCVALRRSHSSFRVY